MVELISLKITDELLRAIVGIFVIVDPIGSVGIFLSVTKGSTSPHFQYHWALESGG